MKVKSLDDLSIWWLHERTSRDYYTCKDLTTCPSKVIEDDGKEECNCHYKQVVVPQDIGEWWQPVKLEGRSYIPIGAKCPICLSSIIHKRDAWITHCGHSFHRNCLMKSYEIYMNNPKIEKYTNVMPCPCCRSDLPTCCCGYNLGRYHSIYGERRNELDYLENFELLSDMIIPIECYKCSKKHKCAKYIGMSNDCKECKEYQEKGHDWGAL